MRNQMLTIKVFVLLPIFRLADASFLNSKVPQRYDFGSSSDLVNYESLKHSKFYNKEINLHADESGHLYSWSSSKSELRASSITTEDVNKKIDEYQTFAADESTKQFLSAVRTSLQNNNFVSFALRGPKLTNKKKKKNPESFAKEKEKLRGSIKLVTGRLILLSTKKNQKRKNENHEKLYVQATIKFHGATDVAKNWEVSTDDNESRSEVEIGLEDLISGKFLTNLRKSAGNVDFFHEDDHFAIENGIQEAELVTTIETHSIQKKKPSSKFLYQVKRKKNQGVDNDQIPTKSLSHDKAKNVPLSSNAEFLQKLGVSNKEGKPRPGMSSKLRQCQRFVQIVGTLIENNIPLEPIMANNESHSSKKASLKIVDMGCGRGYLTFSLHSYLMEIYGSSGSVIESVGIDIRPKLVREINAIAKGLGEKFSTLHFVEGAIEQFSTSPNNKNDKVPNASDNDDELMEKNNNDSNLDVLIALHACDTATDDSLWFGISKNAKIIVSAPCCHKETRRQLDPYVAKMKSDHPLYDVLRHGIYRERIAESVTDSIRALLLEIAGYDVQVFEFIGGEHTSKNVMITAVKRNNPTKSKLKTLRERLHSLAAMHGIVKQKLGYWMGESMVPNDDEGDPNFNGKNILNTAAIPPLPSKRRLQRQ